MAMRSAQNAACNAQFNNCNAQHATRDAHLRACWRFLERAALQSFSPQSQRGPYKTESCTHARCIPPKQRRRSAHSTMCGCAAAAPASHQPELWRHCLRQAQASKCGWPQSIHCEKVRKSGRTLPQCIRCEGASSTGRQTQLFMTCGGARCRAQWRPET